MQPNRGGLILAFGILSWFTCPVLGIVAWVMGNGDLREMRAGRMDPSGEGLATAGKILGMVSAILTGVGILCWIAFFVMLLLAAAA
ncbi:MAG: hypothetical protein CMJ48_13025 [Planctomycetaceae bacterium]|nr:hypothetical protein [Planctomycetaceae bacterium]